MSLSMETIKTEYEKGDYAKALYLIERMEAHGLVHPDILVWKGRCLQLIDRNSYRLSDIENTFKQALILDAEYVPALVELGWFYLNVYDDAPRASELFGKAISVERETLT